MSVCVIGFVLAQLIDPLIYQMDMVYDNENGDIKLSFGSDQMNYMCIHNALRDVIFTCDTLAAEDLIVDKIKDNTGLPTYEYWVLYKYLLQHELKGKQANIEWYEGIEYCGWEFADDIDDKFILRDNNSQWIEEYFRRKMYPYERIDGNGEQAAMNTFCSPDSNSFIFLLTTKAGAVGLNKSQGVIGSTNNIRFENIESDYDCAPGMVLYKGTYLTAAQLPCSVELRSVILGEDIIEHKLCNNQTNNYQYDGLQYILSYGQFDEELYPLLPVICDNGNTILHISLQNNMERYNQYFRSLYMYDIDIIG